MRRTFKQPNKQQRSYPLRSKVMCGCCKHAMDYAPKKSPVYRCGYTRNDETELCYKQEISESLLNKKVENYRVQYNKYRQSAEQTRLANDEKLKNLQIAKTVKKENTLTQALADMLIDKVYVYPDNKLEIEWKIKDFCTDTTVMLS
jgi:hypothetical protein